MRFLSICSGIEAASEAWRPLGFRAAGFAEIDKQASAVLAYHHPHVPNFGDFTKIDPRNHDPIDVLVGGTPCQDFSLAGLRAGLGGVRGNLSLEYGRLAQRERSRWLLWENVPGVLSSHAGRDFAKFLGLLSGQIITPPRGGWQNAGIIPGYKNAYGLAYRVLDAQFVRVDGFGWAVPQRRRRVFVVGYLGDWRRAAAVLLEWSSLRGDSAPRRQAGQDLAGAVADRLEGRREFAPPVSHALNASKGGDAGKGAHERTYIPAVVPPLLAGDNRTGGHRSPGMTVDTIDSIVAFFGGNNTQGEISVAPALLAHGRMHQDFETETLIAFEANATEVGAWADGTVQSLRGMNASGGRQNSGSHIGVCIPILEAGARAYNTNERQGVGIGDDGDPMFTLQAKQQHAIAFSHAQITSPTNRSTFVPGGVSPSLASGGQPMTAAIGHNSRWAVRKLTPRECERLQAFPDDYTLVPYGRRMMADGPRYKLLGNSMAVNVMRWIGGRIAMVDGLDRPIVRKVSL